MKHENLLSMYDGAFEPWKARLAISRIKALGFPRREWPDLMQELAILILEFEYDPKHRKGAKEDTALFAVINRHLLFVMRGRCRERKRFDQHLRGLGIREDGSHNGHEPCLEIDIPLSMDVRQALDEVSRFDRVVARCLARGMTRGAIARKLRRDWKTINRSVRRIRKQFEESGIGMEGLR